MRTVNLAEMGRNLDRHFHNPEKTRYGKLGIMIHWPSDL